MPLVCFPIPPHSAQKLRLAEAMNKFCWIMINNKGTFYCMLPGINRFINMDLLKDYNYVMKRFVRIIIIIMRIIIFLRIIFILRKNIFSYRIILSFFATVSWFKSLPSKLVEARSFPRTKLTSVCWADARYFNFGYDTKTLIYIHGLLHEEKTDLYIRFLVGPTNSPGL